MLIQFLRDRRGSIAPIFAVVLIPMLIAIGAAVDYSRAFRQRVVVQDALDAAALAAAKKIGKSDETTIKSDAQSYYSVNVGNKVDIVPTMTPTVSINTATVTLETTLRVPTYFLGIIGLRQFVYNLSAQATQGLGTLEVAMALDNSGSMAGTKISTLITAASDLTDTLFNLGATSTKLDPIKVAVIPFAGSVNVGASNRTSGWMDTTGVNPYHGENFEASTGSPPVSTNSPAVNVFDLYDSMTVDWGGCVEERPAPYDVQDDAATTSTPSTMFVPMFAPDEPDSWTCTASNGCSKTCNTDASGTNCTTSSTGFRVNGAPAGTFGYNNYLPDANSLTCSPAVTFSIAKPAVVTRASHGLTAGTSVVFQTTGSLPTGITAGTTYYVTSYGLATNTFDLTTQSSSTAFTIGPKYTTVTISNATPAVFTATGHGLTIGTNITLTTTNTLPTGLATATNYYVATVPSTSTFTVTTTSGAGTTVTASGSTFTKTSHGLTAGTALAFKSTGNLPTGLSANTAYYILSGSTNLKTDSFKVSTSTNGTAVSVSGGSGTLSYVVLSKTSSAGSGTHSYAIVGDPSLFTSNSHGLSNGDAIVLSSTGTLPSPLAASTLYYVINSTTNTFQLSPRWAAAASPSRAPPPAHSASSSSSLPPARNPVPTASSRPPPTTIGRATAAALVAAPAASARASRRRCLDRTCRPRRSANTAARPTR
jgi:Flp pilus assembly protein TadG